jgi:peptidyl-Lys metalloendopeptidase
VFTNQPYKVYLCNAFWAAPNTGTDSRAGTIIHELSHFTVVAGTDDFAYGQTAARRLATKRPARAIMNADSHEYFSENTPRQD